MNLNIKKFLTKKNLIRAGFLLLFVLTVYLITCIFQVKSEHGINQVEGMYWQPEDSIDVVKPCPLRYQHGAFVGKIRDCVLRLQRRGAAFVDDLFLSERAV